MSFLGPPDWQKGAHPALSFDVLENKPSANGILPAPIASSLSIPPKALS